MAAMIDHQSVMILKDKDRFQNYFTDYFGYERTKIENLVSLVHKRTEFATQYEKKSGNRVLLFRFWHVFQTVDSHFRLKG